MDPHWNSKGLRAAPPPGPGARPLPSPWRLPPLSPLSGLTAPLALPLQYFMYQIISGLDYCHRQRYNLCIIF